MSTSDITLYDLLMQRTKESLISSARSLDLRIPTSLRKAPFALKMANSLLFNPLWLLRRLPYPEVLKLQKMVHAQDHSILVRPSYADDCLTEIGLTWFPKSEEGIKERISDDFAEVLAPVIDGFTSKLDSSSGRLHDEIVLNGLLNLHGILATYDLEDLARELCPALSGDVFYETIDRSYLLRSSLFSDGGPVYLTSRFLFDREAMLSKVEERYSLKSARFSLEEVMAAGDLEVPLPPETPVTRSLRAEMLRTVKEEPEASRWISELWILLNNDRHPGDIIGSFLEKNTLDEKAAKQFILDFLNWANHTPRWVNKGNPASTTYSAKGSSQAASYPPRLRVIHGGQSGSTGIQDEPEQPSVVWSPTTGGTIYRDYEDDEDVTGSQSRQSSGKKPGRNDPCPCGSGKKYKKCCGKPG
jgi:hypothetical protein